MADISPGDSQPAGLLTGDLQSDAGPAPGLQAAPAPAPLQLPAGGQPDIPRAQDAGLLTTTKHETSERNNTITIIHLRDQGFTEGIASSHLC